MDKPGVLLTDKSESETPEAPIELFYHYEVS